MNVRFVSADEGESFKYKLIDENGATLRTYEETEYAINANAEVEKYLKSLEPTEDDRLVAVEDAIAVLMLGGV